MSDEPSKLTRSKERWAQEGRFLTGQSARPESERLPPGQHRVSNWPVLDLGVRPEVSRERWQLAVTGAVRRTLRWNWETFAARATTQAVSDMHCVTTWSRYDNHWIGLPVSELLDEVQPRDEATHVLLHSYDGYITNLPLADFAAPGALLVHSWEGQPLTAEHGGPVRAMIPHLYLWKSAKWLRRIDFRVGDTPGFWEMRGYHDRGDPWQEQRYADDA